MNELPTLPIPAIVLDVEVNEDGVHKYTPFIRLPEIHTDIRFSHGYHSPEEDVRMRNEALATARVIASSHLVLVALLRWEQYARDNGYTEGYSDPGYCSFLADTRDAIVAATGVDRADIASLQALIDQTRNIPIKPIMLPEDLGGEDSPASAEADPAT